MKTELLAPAGDLEAAYTAFGFGADAVYLGLRRFSARAEAANFSIEELGEIAAFAHSATPRRSVFVALNTLVKDDEVDELIGTLASIEAAGADAVIIQDLGVARLARLYFPRLAMHASTQMAIHNVAGALAARKLGFSRVTLARELTLKEVAAIVRDGGADVETFIHGALCYSTSGHCFYSSMLRERSGNRGRCAYPCRDVFTGPGGEKGYPFSMKDLALAGDVAGLRDGGVYSFKIEGRKKSALYVGAAVSYYRGLLDGTLNRVAQKQAEEDIKTVFSRPWTDLYFRSAKNRTVTDAEVVGHRGAPIGLIEAVVKQPRGDWLRFKTSRRIERHDGIQTDVPGQGRPFGFPVDHLRRVGIKGRAPDVSFECEAGEMVEVLLPPEHPTLAIGAPLYCSSSQHVKQHYRVSCPKPGAYRMRIPLRITVSVSPRGVKAVAVAEGTDPAVRGQVIEAIVEGVFEPSRDPGRVESAVREAFGKLGETEFEAAAVTVNNPGGAFVPVSLLNRLRREVTAQMSDLIAQRRAGRLEVVRAAERALPASVGQSGVRPRWSLKTDRLSHLSAFEADDWREIEDVVVDIRAESHVELTEGLERLTEAVGRDRIRLALPVMMREWEHAELREKAARLRDAGWERWDASTLWAWPVLGSLAGQQTDWTVYVLNRSTVKQLFELGVSRVTLSPEDGRDNLQALLGQYGDQATVVVYQDTPLFMSETCALAAMARKCPAGPDCRDSEREWVSGSGETLRLVQQGCRSVTLNKVPFSLAGRLDELMAMGARHVRADFVYRHYEPAEVRRLWRALRKGMRVSGHEGNYTRGLQ